MFKFNSEWNVDQSAEVLNTSLFGKPKKHKTQHATVQVSASNGSKYSSNLPDSDDEQYSKKDKKKLKKLRKKNKQDKKKHETNSPDLHQQHQPLDGLSTSTKKKVKNKDKIGHNKDKPGLDKDKTGRKNLEHKPSVHTSPFKSVTASVKKQKDRTENNKLSDIVGKNNRKRKFSHSENAENSVSKKMKIEDNKDNKSSTNDISVSETGKKKRRNRKKKNNSKKNKYKHLALNSKSSFGDADLPHSNDTVSSVNKKTTDKSDSHESAKDNLHKSSNKLNKKLDISQTTKTGAQGKDQKEGVQKVKYSQGTDKPPLSEKKKNKRKKDKKNTVYHDKSFSHDPLPPTKKVKKNIDNLKIETSTDSMQTSTNSSQTQHNHMTTKSDKLSLPVPKNVDKIKKKQNALLKILSRAQIKQLDKSDNKNIEVNNNKKKSKINDEASITNQDSKKKETKNKIMNNTEQEDVCETISLDVQKKLSGSTPSVSQSIWGKAAVLGQQAKEKLDSARFRYINEQLYSCKGNEALQLFREDKDAFSVYHDGFQNQVNKWPVNPLEVLIKQIKDKPKNLIIADFGCGDAKLEQSIPQKVHSFDLVALNNRVTACDMSKTPLPSGHVDIAVFCLSLMGTNIADYILEANRVLKTEGLLKIAEVVSRFSGLSRFTDSVCSCGFQLLNKRDLNQIFYIMDFKKVKTVKKSASLPAIKLKPCIYKRR